MTVYNLAGLVEARDAMMDCGRKLALLKQECQDLELVFGAMFKRMLPGIKLDPDSDRRMSQVACVNEMEALLKQARSAASGTARPMRPSPE